MTSSILSFWFDAPLTLATSQTLALKAFLGSAEPSADCKIAFEIFLHLRGFAFGSGLLLC